MKKTGNTIGSKIQFYRKKKRLSQNELANLIGYSSNKTISKLENDLFYPTYKTLKLIASALDVSLDDLTVDYIFKYNEDFNDVTDSHYEIFEKIDYSGYEKLALFHEAIKSFEEYKKKASEEMRSAGNV